MAFEALSWKFYFVFIALNLFACFVYWMWLPETNQLTLEEIAGAFGDDVAKDKEPTEGSAVVVQDELVRK